MWCDQSRVSIDFNFVSASDGKVSVFDRGFLFGDSVYEVVRTYNSKIFHLKRHFLRLKRSAESLGFELPFTLDRLTDHLTQVKEGFSNTDCYIRMVVTRGAYEITLCPPEKIKPTVIVIAAKLPPWPVEFYKKGVSLVIVEVRRNSRGALNPMIKSGNYLNNVLAAMEARQNGAVDAVMLNSDGYVTESSTANIFIVKDEKLITPPVEAGILDGVSRFIVMELAKKANIPLEERLFGPEELHHADECFLTSTTRDIMPVCSVDDYKIPSPGKTTLALMGLFKNYTENR